MIDYFSGCVLGVVSCLFWNTGLRRDARLPIHLKVLDHVVSGASFLTGGVFECDLAHRRSLAVLCMMYKIRCSPLHPLYGALPVPYVPVLVTPSHIGSLMLLLAAEPRSIVGLLFHFQYLCGTILVTPSMVWDWRVSKA